MKPTRNWFLLVLALPLILSACGPKEMGAKAPEFGTGKMATTAGFLVGKWKRKLDDSMVSYKAPTLKAFDPGRFLEFKADHTCSVSGYGNDVHMTWKEATNGIELTVVDVDGYDPATIETQSEAEHVRHHQGHSRQFNSSQMSSRASAMTSVPERLELMPDKKRLFNPDSVSASGSSRMGMETWERVE